MDTATTYGMRWEHWSHAEGEPCSPWCYARLPEREGATIAHAHEEGESCLPGRCYYTPTPVGTIKRWWRGWRGR